MQKQLHFHKHIAPNRIINFEITMEGPTEKSYRHMAYEKVTLRVIYKSSLNTTGCPFTSL